MYDFKWPAQLVFQRDRLYRDAVFNTESFWEVREKVFHCLTCA